MPRKKLNSQPRPTSNHGPEPEDFPRDPRAEKGRDVDLGAADELPSEELDDLLVSKDGAPEKPEEEALPPIDGSEAAAPELDVLPEEPDEQILSQQVEEWGELVAEDTLEILEDPVLAVELSEDPVRLYLKEIGQIHLLDADSEFRLAARIEAERCIELLRNQPLRRQRGSSLSRQLFHSICEDLITSWDRLQEDAQRLG